MRFSAALSALVLSLFAACAPPGDVDTGSDDGTSAADSSPIATFLVFTFDGYLEAAAADNPESRIREQLTYTIGQLNHSDHSVGRMDRLTISGIRTTPLPNERVRVDYHAQMPVAWGKGSVAPARYRFTLPRHLDHMWDFEENHVGSCGTRPLWYYYDLKRPSCHFGPDELAQFDATVTLSPWLSHDKYPEYDRIWSDKQLRVVALFATTGWDKSLPAGWGAHEYEEFVDSTSSRVGAGGWSRLFTSVFGGAKVTTVPASLPSHPAESAPEITFNVALTDGRSISITAIYTDAIEVQSKVAERARIAALSDNADAVFYNGHSGLGTNIRQLAEVLSVRRRQYQVILLNGCDTYAYFGQVWAARSDLNPDDPRGTKYLDVVVNAMPSSLKKMAETSMAVLGGLLSDDVPMTYDQILGDIDQSQVALVTGDEDNTYVPNEAPKVGKIVDALDTVVRGQERRYSTPLLPAGHYVFSLTGTGDADLYVRGDFLPTVSAYDCRPYKKTSSERCEIDLTRESRMQIMIRGADPSSRFALIGVQR